MKLVQGAPYYLNQQNVFLTEAGDSGRVIDESARVVMVTLPGLTLKLPADPNEGLSVRIVALETVNLDGNGNLISGGGGSVSKGTALDLTFYAGVWTPSGNGQALDVKANCRLLATANVVLAGLPIIDGVQTLDGDRILLTGQANPIDNSIRIAHPGPWERAADMAAGSSAENVFTFISEGTLHADTGWLCTTDRPNDVVGTDPLAWTQFSTFPLAVLPPVNVSRSAALVGVSNTAARQDHKHDVVTAAPATQSIGAGSTGVGPGLALADHVHPVTAPVAPVNVTKAAALPGVSVSFARQDHKHDVTTAVPIAVGLANNEGTSTSLARADHEHAPGVAANVLVQNKFSTVDITQDVPAAMAYTTVNSFPFTAAAGGKVRYSAYLLFQVDLPSAVDAKIVDTVGGDIAFGQQGIPTVVIILGSTMMIEWEVTGVAAGPRTVSLQVRVNAGTLHVLRSYVAIDEFVP